MKEIIPFQFEEKEIRIIQDEKGEPWFVGKDVCDALGYADAHAAISKHCKHAKLLKTDNSSVLDVPSRGLLIFPESDLYRLTIKSEKPEADKFEDWVVEEVLPSIRKTGSYALPGDPTFQRYRNRLPSLQTVLNTYTCAIKAAKTTGLSQRQAAESANKGALKAYGVNCLELLEIDLEQLSDSDIKKKVAKANAEDKANLAESFFEALNALPKKEREKYVEVKDDCLLLRLSHARKALKIRGHRFDNSDLMLALKNHPAFVESNKSCRAYFGSSAAATTKVWVFDYAIFSAAAEEKEGGLS